MIQGEIIAAPGDIELNTGRERILLSVANSGDRPIQVGSHYHFYESNPALQFDRESIGGFRLDLPAGTAVPSSRISVVRDVRSVRKKDMVLNDYQPDSEVDPQTYEVPADGRLLTCAPAKILPMAQRYFFFCWPEP